MVAWKRQRQAAAHLIIIPQKICVPRRSNGVDDTVVQADVSTRRIVCPEHEHDSIDERETQDEEQQQVLSRVSGHFRVFSTTVFLS
jgi:hypothetical protein